VLPAPFYGRDGQIAIDLPGAEAVFTTRSWGDVRTERAEIERRLGVPTRFTKQIHGNRVVRADESAAMPNGDLGLEADALVTASAGIAPSILTADCLPIAIAAPGTDAAPAVVATVHAGWRGLADGVIANAIGLLGTLGSQRPLTAAIGPAAGPCCYEVGPELHQRFPGFSAGRNLDLKAIARHQLQAAGVTGIHDCRICTICESEYELFSYRREGEQTGRQGLIAWLS
jgi:YfiH family protein